MYSTSSRIRIHVVVINENGLIDFVGVILGEILCSDLVKVQWNSLISNSLISNQFSGPR